MRRHWWTIGITLALTMLVLLAVPALWFNPDEYSAWASGIGVFFVAGSLLIAAAAVMNDNVGHRFDRTLALHEQFVSGELQAARLRLGSHLGAVSDDDLVHQPTWSELQSDDAVGNYGSSPGHTPVEDASLILKYFERAYEAVRANAVHEPFFVRTIGREGCWWARAFERIPATFQSQEALQQLLVWADDYVEQHPRDSPNDWGRQRRIDFPPPLEERLAQISHEIA